ncbi:glycosyltransferase [Bacillus pakistanensis]|nr:glycosyltransferase [Bacillus pakistanensis]
MKERFQEYDAIWIPDDDILINSEEIMNFFNIIKSYDLLLAQPSLTHDSYIGHWKITEHQNGNILRYTNYVEIMAPGFSKLGFKTCIETFQESHSGFGLDFTWPRIMGLPKNKIAVIDEVLMKHTRPSKTGDLYPQLIENPINEGRRVCLKYGINWDDCLVAETYGRVKSERSNLNVQKNSICFIIPTTTNRERVLYKVVKHLLRDIPFPFSLYIYNDRANPLIPALTRLIKAVKRNDIKLVVYNDTGKLNNNKIGAGGARNLMFEETKLKHDVVISLDDDMQLKPQWVENVINAMNKYPKHCVFTGIVRGQDGKIQFAGSKFKINNNTLYRYDLTDMESKYKFTDWGPIGCMAFCRSALTESVYIPPLYIRDDASFYLLLRKFGINETVVVSDAESIHKPISVPSSNLRLKEELEKERGYFRKLYGLELGY